MRRLSEEMQGLRDAVPIMTAYFPIAMTFGILCTSSGLPWTIACVISLAVYAGGAQFMLIALASAGTSSVSTVITILLVNVRHVLYGTALADEFSIWSTGQRLLAAFGLTDEVFAFTSSRLRAGDRLTPPTPGYQIPFTFGCYASWVLGTVLGAAVGQIFPQAWTNVLEYALPALFIALLFLGIQSAPHFIAAVCGGAVACAADVLHIGSAGIVAGAVIGSTFGYATAEWRKGKLPARGAIRKVDRK